MLFGPLGMWKFISLPFLGDFFCIDIYCKSTLCRVCRLCDKINVRLSFGSLFDVLMSMRRTGWIFNRGDCVKSSGLHMITLCEAAIAPPIRCWPRVQFPKRQWNPHLLGNGNVRANLSRKMKMGRRVTCHQKRKSLWKRSSVTQRCVDLDPFILTLVDTCGFSLPSTVVCWPLTPQNNLLQCFKLHMHTPTHTRAYMHTLNTNTEHNAIQYTSDLL